MPHATASDGVKLFFEETGSGTPIIFVHEFAGDMRSWEPQVRFFSRQYRCIVYNARGYPPSDVPEKPDAYSQDRATDDIRDVLKHMGIPKAHVVGLSMGGFAALHFGIRHPGMALSLAVCGCGYGAQPDKREQFQKEATAQAEKVRTMGQKEFADAYALGPTRVQFQNKDPRGWAEFHQQLTEHSPVGATLTLLGVQRMRPSLYDLTDKMAKITVPTLIVNGDEDEPCLDPGNLMKRSIPTAGLVVFPKTGHTLNIEEPALFNATLQSFFHAVEAGKWGPRDPRSVSTSILGR
jgi:pimeloyl-ACP methyl ester carboxylesterase